MSLMGNTSVMGEILWRATKSSIVRVVAMLPVGDEDNDFCPMIIGKTVAVIDGAAPTVCSVPRGARAAM